MSRDLLHERVSSRGRRGLRDAGFLRTTVIYTRMRYLQQAGRLGSDLVFVRWGSMAMLQSHWAATLQSSSCEWIPASIDTIDTRTPKPYIAGALELKCSMGHR